MSGYAAWPNLKIWDGKRRRACTVLGCTAQHLVESDRGWSQKTSLSRVAVSTELTVQNGVLTFEDIPHANSRAEE